MEFYALTRKSNVVFFGENSMNKSFKVVFNKARGALMVVNEVTSSVQAKGTKTVIAAAVAALAAGGVAAAEWVDAPKDLKSVSVTQEWEKVKDQNSFVHEGEGPAYFLHAEETKTFDKTLWVSGEGEKSKATGLYVTGEDVKLTNEGTIYVSSGEKGKSWQNRAMMAGKGGEALNNGLIVAKNAYGMSVESVGPATIINNNRIVVEETGAGMELGGASGSTAVNAGLISVGTPTKEGNGGRDRFGHGVLIKDTSKNEFTNYGTIEAAEGATAIEVQVSKEEGVVTGTTAGNILNFEAGSKIVGEVHIQAEVTGTVINANGFQGELALNNESKQLTINVKDGAELKLADGYGSTISEAVIENGKLTASIWQSYTDADGKEASDNIFTKVVVKEDGIFNVKQLNSGGTKDKSHDTLLIKGSEWTLDGGALQVAGQNYTEAVKVGTADEKQAGSLTINSGDYSFTSLEIGKHGQTTVTGDLTVGALTLSGATVADDNYAHVLVTENGSLTLNGALTAKGKYQDVDDRRGVYVEGNLILGEEANLTDVKEGALTINGELTAKQEQIFQGKDDNFELTDLAKKINFTAESGLLLTTETSMEQEAFEEQLATLEEKLNGNTDIVFTNLNIKGGAKFSTKLGFNGYSMEVDASGEQAAEGKVSLDATGDDVAVGALKVATGTTDVSLKNGDKEFVFAGLGGNVITGVDSVESITADGEVTLGWDETSKGVVNAKTLNVQKLSVAGQFEATDVKVAQDSQVEELGSLKVEKLTGDSAFTVQQGATLDVRQLAIDTKLMQGSTLVIGDRLAADTTEGVATLADEQLDALIAAKVTVTEADSIATTNANGRNLLTAFAGDEYDATKNVGLYVDNKIAVDRDAPGAKLFVGSIDETGKPDGSISLGSNAVVVIDVDAFSADKAVFDAKQLIVNSDSKVLLKGADRIGSVKLVENGTTTKDNTGLRLQTVLAKNDTNAWLNYEVEQVQVEQGEGQTATTDVNLNVVFDKEATKDDNLNAFAEKVLTTGSESVGVVNAIGTAYFDETTKKLSAVGEEALDEYMALPAVAGTYNAAYDAAEQVWNTIGAHNIDRTAGKTNGVWADVFYSANEAGDMYGNGYGYEADVYGGVLGYDYTAACGGKIGAALTIGTSDVDAKGDFIGDYGNDADFWGLSIYASKDITEKMIVSADITYLSLDNDIKGSVAGASVAESIDSSVISVGLRADWKAYESNAFEIVPHAGIRYAQIDVDDYREMDGESLDVLEMPIGVAFNGKFEAAGMKFVPTLDFTVVPQIGDTEVHPLNGDTLDVLNNTYNTTLGISAEYGDFTFGVAAKYGFGTDDRSNAGVKVNATYAF